MSDRPGSMKIVFIHGINQQNLDAIALKQYWLEVLQLGFQNLNCTRMLNECSLDFPFYGDVLEHYGLRNTLNIGSFTFNQTPSKPLHSLLKPHLLDLTTTNQTPFLPRFLSNPNLSFSSKIYLLSQMAKDYVLKDFIMMLNYFPKLHEDLMHEFIVEAYLYLSNHQFIDEVNCRIRQCLKNDEDYLIVAHSLGTVVAYNVIRQLPAHFRLKALITLGSPLAFHVIQSKIPQPIVYPDCLHGHWYNFYSPDDFVSCFALDAPPFQFEPAIINHSIRTFLVDPHDISGYLQHPAVIQCIVETLSNPEQKPMVLT